MSSGSPVDDAQCIASYSQVCQKIYKEHKDTCNKVSLLYLLIEIWFNLLQKVAKNICNSKEGQRHQVTKKVIPWKIHSDLDSIFAKRLLHTFNKLRFFGLWMFQWTQLTQKSFPCVFHLLIIHVSEKPQSSPDQLNLHPKTFDVASTFCLIASQARHFHQLAKKDA